MSDFLLLVLAGSRLALCYGAMVLCSLAALFAHLCGVNCFQNKSNVMRKLPLSKIYNGDAEELLSARKSGRILHSTGDN